MKLRQVDRIYDPHSWIIVLVLLLIDFAAFPGMASPKFYLTDLGAGTSVSDVNNSREVVGTRNGHAFLYDGTMHDLGTLGGTTSFGRRINAAGQVVGWSETTGDVTTHAFFYDGLMHDLGPSDGGTSFGVGINSSGTVVGNFQHFSPTHAFLYDGSLHDLGTLGGDLSFASSINNLGEIVGDSDLYHHYGSHPFIYDGTMHDIGTLGGRGGTANDINDSGEVTGLTYIVGDTALHAFFYDGTMVDLGTLGGTNSYGISLNTSGEVVGSSDTAGGAGSHAFLFDGAAMLDLNDLIDITDPLLDQITLTEARGINNAGDIVANGYDVLTGVSHAFLLAVAPAASIPGPGSAALFPFGLAVLAFARRHQRG
jgi:probable HAF family extracellular repeat protein